MACCCIVRSRAGGEGCGCAGSEHEHEVASLHQEHPEVISVWIGGARAGLGYWDGIGILSGAGAAAVPCADFYRGRPGANAAPDEGGVADGV